MIKGKRKNFTAELTKLLATSMFNDYTDNHDPYRYGPAPVITKKKSIKSAIKQKLKERGFENKNPAMDFLRTSLDKFSDKMDYFEYIYNVLDDDYSCELLLKVCAFRILGNKKIKLPMNNPVFWSTVKDIEENAASKTDFIYPQDVNHKLFKHDLSKYGYPLQVYLRSLAIYYDFIYQGYSYKQGGVTVEVENGDNVIDAGACYGDTAMCFAHKSGSKGKIYSLEFVPSNLEILRKNIAMNEKVAKQIEVIEHPLWSTSQVPVYFESKGSGTRVKMEKISEDSEVVMTVTIDELVESGKIEKVDFIKMDIEGAEVEALKGAIQTIKKFKPKMALCLYHSESDFKDIPEFVKGLDLGYKFYFNHYTMHAGESVLFCKI